MPVIEKFSGANRFLSNFWPCEVELDAEVYRTVEHAYQAAKTLDLQARAYIRQQPTPGRAKKLGREVEQRPNWEDMKVAVMRMLLRQKFQDPVLRAKLLGTGDCGLMEGNNWGDRFWGVCRGKGENWLGVLLMQVREEIRGVQPEQDRLDA